jgi:hypothetical protein
MIDTVLNYLNNSGAIPIGVLALLSFYFILVFWIFLYKYFKLSSYITIEMNNLNSLLTRNSNLNPLSKIGQCVNKSPLNKESLNMCEITLIRDASNGISWLSIISSTAPFVGLFGTVVGILESFANF